MGMINSDFYSKYIAGDVMEMPFEAREMIEMASFDLQEQYADLVQCSGDACYLPADVLLALLEDRTFFARIMMILDSGENVILSGLTLAFTSEHLSKMGLSEQDAANLVARFLENEKNLSFSIDAAVAGRQERVTGIYIFANGWFGVETECLEEPGWHEKEEDPNAEPAWVPSSSYLFSDEGDLVATPDIRYDIRAWMNFVDTFSVIHEEASAWEKSDAPQEEEGQEFIVFSREVKTAMEEGKPVVVIESAATFGGMIYPGIAEFAFRMRNTVRENGAVPAFAAIIRGQVHIGLNDDEIYYLEQRRGSIFKASARDIPILLAKKTDGVMTIAAAVQVAALAGIPVACGSGIGGAQIGAEKTMDISTDLESVARNPVMVVCSGTKPILDLSLTMEYLETAGVPVIGYGTDQMPEYMVRGSGFRLTYRMDTPRELADVMKIKKNMNIPGGVLVVNPIPAAFEIDANRTREAVEKAAEDVQKNNVMGKAITGYMMGRIKEYLGDRSVESQKAFLINNAELAAKVACEIG